MKALTIARQFFVSLPRQQFFVSLPRQQFFVSLPRQRAKFFARAAAFALVAAALAGGAPGCTKKADDRDTSLNIVSRANIKGLDPISGNDLYSGSAIDQIFEGLLEYDYLKRPYTLKPALAEAMPVASADGLTYTIKIRPGARFQDDPCFKDGKGREVVAEDFIYSWKRLADPRNASEGFWIFDAKIKGLNDWANAVKAEKADYGTPVAGLQAPDPRTLVIALNQPYFQLGYALAMTFSSVVPKEAVEKYGKEFLNHPVGTGPYQLESWVRNSKLVLKRNPGWRGEAYPSEGMPGDKEAGLLADAGKPVPFADKITIAELAEDSPRWQNFQKGNFDISEIPPDAFETAVKDKKIAPELAAKGVKLQFQPAGDTTYTAFNMKDPLLGKNADLRHAIAMAQDMKTFIHNFYNDRAIAANGPIPPDFASYDPAFKNKWQGYDVAAAKELLKKAGYPDGKGLPELVYEGLSDSKSRQQAEFFQQNLAAIGIKVAINANTWPQFQEKVKRQQAQVFGVAWAADYPDPQNFYQLFYSKNASPGPNDTSFSNEEFDKLYEKSLAMAPGPERDAEFAKMRDIVVEQSPWLFIAHREMYRAYHGWVHNFKPNELAQKWYKYVRVDAKERGELKAKL